MSGPVIPLASRRAESLMPFPVADRRATVPAYPSLVAAGADVAEADPAQGIAADPSVIDAERHPLYGHGVEHRPSCACGECSQRIAEYEAAMTCSVCAQYGDGCNCESVRLGRLSRWQEQR